MNSTLFTLFRRLEGVIPHEDMDPVDYWDTGLDPWQLPRDALNAITPYGYVPTQGLAIFFLVWFGLSTLVHLVQAVHTRRWFMLLTVLVCGAGELVAWASRFQGSNSPLTSRPYYTELTAGLIAPTFLLLAIYIIAGSTIKQLGPCYSRLSPKKFLILFISLDVVSLLLQAIGGGMSVFAYDLPSLGAIMMLSGVAIQTVVIVAFWFFFGEFLFRYNKDKPISGKTRDSERGMMSPKLKMFIGAVMFVVLLVLARSIYRIVELQSLRWNEKFTFPEWCFSVFDGAMIALAMTILNVFHPGYWLRPQHTGRVSKGATNTSLL